MTGEKAKEAVQRAHDEFGKLADEAIQAINKDKGKFKAHLIVGLLVKQIQPY